MRLSTLACLLVCLGFGPGFGSSASASERPNILVFMADDLGAAELGCYGHGTHHTPRLDGLADEGVRFETAWSTPLCTPTRVQLLTGQYAPRTGYYNFLGRVHSPLKSSPLYDIGSKTTFADALQASGYRTVAAGKWQLTGGPEELVHDCGFDSYRVWMWLHERPEGADGFGWQSKNVPSRFWHPGILEDGRALTTSPDDYGPDLYADFLIDAFKNRGDQPLCAYFPMALTHTPWDPAPDGEGGRTPRGLQANVESMDRVVGRLLDALDECGEADNTIVIFTADNGTEKAGKKEVSPRGAGVPLLIRWPGVVEPGRVSEALVDLTDVFPTLVDLAGGEVPTGHKLDGCSLVPHLRHPSARHRDWIVTMLGEERCLRDGSFLWTREGELIDLESGRLAEDTREALIARRRFARLWAHWPAPRRIEGLRRPAAKGN